MTNLAPDNVLHVQHASEGPQVLGNRPPVQVSHGTLRAQRGQRIWRLSTRRPT